MKRNVAIVCALLGMCAVAGADVQKRGYVLTGPIKPGTEFKAPTPANVSHIIFLDRCVGGCTITPGSDGTQNQSAIISGTKHLSAFAGTDAQWSQVVSCVQQTYAPFNVTITDQRPASGAYHHAMVAGTATEGGQSNGVVGVSPFSQDCSYIPNAMSFSFANSMVSLPNPIVEMCWTVSQETAHSWGLDHKFDKLDPMTYLENGSVQKAFQNQAGSCGEYSARACNCTYPGTGSSAMNAYALVLATFGSGVPDTTNPTVAITAPSNNAQVMPSFAVTANAMDDVGVAKVDFTLDGALIGSATSSPFKATGPATLSQGSHHLVATATDFSGNTAMAAIDVAFGQICTTGGCTDPNQVCVDGHCVAGPNETGGLGSPCTDNASCASGSCGDDGAGNKYCVEPCDPTMNQCPGGFGCLATSPGAGVCWPGADNGGGGGCNTNGGNSGVIFAGLGFAVALVTRRRRSKR